MEQASRGTEPEPARVQESFGQSSQTSILIFGWSCADPDVGLNDPCGSLPTQDNL